MGYRSTRLPPRRSPAKVVPAVPTPPVARKRPFAELRILDAPGPGECVFRPRSAPAARLFGRPKQPAGLTEGDVKDLAAQVMASATPPPSLAAVSMPSCSPLWC